MKNALLSLKICLALMFAVGGVRAETPLKLTVEQSNQITLTDLGNGEWEAVTTGHDPYFYLKAEGDGFDPASDSILEFEYFSTGRVGRVLVFVGEVLDIPRMIVVGDVSGREGYGPFTVDLTTTREQPALPVRQLRVTLGEAPGLTMRLRNFRVRPRNDQEQRIREHGAALIREDRELESLLKGYFGRKFSSSVDEVSADGDTIEISGMARDGEAVQLAEVPMWEEITRLKNPAALIDVKPNADGKFSVRVSRAEAKDRERLLSGWALVKQKEQGGYEAVSALRYVERQVVANPPAQMKPTTLKGMGGCLFDHPDILDLGVKSVTLNIVLNHLFMDSPPADGQGEAFPFAGQTWYLNRGVINDYDSYMKKADELGLMVSAIILLPPPRTAAPTAWIRTAGNPDFDGQGIYVLPNFSTKEGVNAYAAAMAFLTERYGQEGSPYGRIHHWIMHNEVNSGFYWSNAGDKTALTYLNLYQKSMRTAWILAGRFDPHSKPLISLEHCWTIVLDPRAYAGRDLLEYLALFSRREGDFPWGIAYHPYAQDLRNPRTWEDADARHDFLTPFITFKNVEVIDAWARLPRVSYHGEPREIQFTEQGLNTPDYSEKSLQDQLAGVAYAWKKIKALPSVTAFQYHNWMDHPDEGGLRLGIRKFPNDPEDPLGKKPSWELYRVLDTEAEAALLEQARATIGIKDWSEIHATGELVDPGPPVFE